MQPKSTRLCRQLQYIKISRLFISYTKLQYFQQKHKSPQAFWDFALKGLLRWLSFPRNKNLVGNSGLWNKLGRQIEEKNLSSSFIQCPVKTRLVICFLCFGPWLWLKFLNPLLHNQFCSTSRAKENHAATYVRAPFFPWRWQIMRVIQWFNLVSQKEEIIDDSYNKIKLHLHLV